ncbi:MAG: hypothetical protein ABEJ89_05425 [Haloarculaceae archaeon]
MADLSPPVGKASRDRAQIVLLGAVVLGVVFVSLAVIANAAIYTGNIASRAETAGSGDALIVRSEVLDNVGAVIEQVNVYNTSDRDAALRRGVRNASNQTGYFGADNGRITAIEYGGFDGGTRIADNASGGSGFGQAAGTGPNWDVAANANGIRAFEIEFDRASVVDDQVDQSPQNYGDEFIANLTGSGDPWEIHVGDDGSGATVWIVRGGTTLGRCHVPGSPRNFTVDVTGGTVAGRPCPSLTAWTAASGGLTLHYQHGGAVRGNYSLVVDGGTINTGGSKADAGPYATPAVYAVVVHLVHDTPDLHFETDVRVAPGEPDG